MRDDDPEAAANPIPDDTQYISSPERNEILEQSRYNLGYGFDDDSNGIGQHNDSDDNDSRANASIGKSIRLVDTQSQARGHARSQSQSDPRFSQLARETDDSSDELADAEPHRPSPASRGGPTPCVPTAGPVLQLPVTDAPEMTITSPSRLSPTTPATLMAGRKRDRHSNVVSIHSARDSDSPPPTRTPAPNLAAFFSGVGTNNAATTLGLSQLFQQTQAGNSPYTTGLRSDPIFERPSPDFKPPGRSSTPAAPLSSPFQFRQVDRTSSLTPTSTAKRRYISLKDSQDQKDRLAGGAKQQADQQSPPASSSDSNSTDDGDSGIGKVRKGPKRSVATAMRRSFRTDRASELRTPIRKGQRGGMQKSSAAQSTVRRRSSVKQFGARSRDVEHDDEHERRAESDPDLRSSLGQKSRVPRRPRTALDAQFDKDIEVPMSTSRTQHDGNPSQLPTRKRKRGQAQGSLDGEEQRKARETVIRFSIESDDEMQEEPMPNSHSDPGIIVDSQTNPFEGLPVPPPPNGTCSREPSHVLVTQSQEDELSSATRTRTQLGPIPSTDSPSSAPLVSLSPSSEQGDLQRHHSKPSSPLSSPPLGLIISSGEVQPSEKTKKRVPDLDSARGSRKDNYIGTTPGSNLQSERKIPSSGNLPSIRGRRGRTRARYSVPDTSSPRVTQVISETSEINSSSKSGRTGSQQATTTHSEEQAKQSNSTALFETARDYLSALGSPVKARTPTASQRDDADHGGDGHVTPIRPVIRDLADIAAAQTPPSIMKSLGIDIDILNDEDRHFQALTANEQSPLKAVGARRNREASTLLPLQQAEMDSMATGMSAKESTEAAVTISAAIPDAALHMDATKASPPTERRPVPLKARSRGKLKRSKLSNQITPRKEPELQTESKIGASAAANNMMTNEAKQKNSSTTNSSTSKSAYIINNSNVSSFQPRQLDPLDVGVATNNNDKYSDMQDQQRSATGEARFPQRVFARFLDSKLAYYPATCLSKVPFKHNEYRVQFDDGTSAELDVFHMRSCELRPGDQVKVDLPSMRTSTYVVMGLDDLAEPQESSAAMEKTDIFGHKSVLLEVKQRTSLAPGGGEATAGGRTGSTTDNVVKVPISSIYFPNTFWARLKDREFNYAEVSRVRTLNGGGTEGLQTPLDAPSSRATSPPSRAGTRRQQNVSVDSGSRVPLLHGLLDGGGQLFSNMMFAITYSSEKDTEKERSRVERLIMANGGRILASGFDELFDLPFVAPTAGNGGPPTPSKRASARAVAAAATLTIGATAGDGSPAPDPPRHPDEGDSSNDAPTSTAQRFALSAAGREAGFVALIANSHCRRTKYMQALSLNIPCLSGRWITDCASQGRILAWPPYLLAAGESSLINGAVRSRVLAPPLCITDARDAKDSSEQRSSIFPRFVDATARRPTIFQGKRVLVYKDKSMTEEQTRTYLFMLHALGAAKAERVSDLATLRAIVLAAPEANTTSAVSGTGRTDRVGWDRLYTKEKAIPSIRQALALKQSGAAAAANGAVARRAKNESVTEVPVQVLSEECIAQSVIAGVLLDQV